MAINNDYNSLAQKPASKKAVLAHVQPTQRLVLWELDSGAVYKRIVNDYVVGVSVAGVDLTEESNSSLSAGAWFFEYENKTLYVRMADDSSPQSNFVVAEYRLFFSDFGINAPFDLTENGNPVHYEPLIKSTSQFKQELDNAELLGISLESEGQIIFENNSGYFDSRFDKLFWDNKKISIYSYFPDSPITEAKLIFEGEIENKRYTSSRVTFRLKDFIYRLRQPVKLDFFSSADGTISNDVAGVKYKRRIYGQVDGLKMQSLDQVLEGISLTGTIAGSADSPTITGAGTLFLSEVSPGDEISYITDLETKTIKVDSVESDISLTASEETEVPFSNLPATIKHEIPIRTRNRVFHIAGHKLREPTTTVITGVQLNRFTMDTTDFFVNDTIKVGTETAKIKRISGQTIVLFQNLDTFPSAGTTVSKNPIRNIFFNQKELLIDRDFTVSNTTECKINFNDLAEFNATNPQKLEGTLDFTNGSRDVVGTGTNFDAVLKPRDWIVSDDLAHQVYYEILEVVDATNLKLRVAYFGVTNLGSISKRKNVTYIGDESIVTVNCIGKENGSGEWIKTASDAVKDLITTDADLTNLDLDSFTDSKNEAGYIVSFAIPLEPEGEPKTIRETITLINQSVFGSLVARTNFQISYNVLTPDRPTDGVIIKDDDIIGGAKDNFNVGTHSDVRRKITVKYKHFDADRFTGEKGNDSAEFTNNFVDYLIGTKNEKIVDVYLYEQGDAETIAERYGLIHSLTQNIVTIKTKLNLALKNLNDKIYISFERLFDRFGNSDDTQKVGIISAINRGPSETVVTFSDLSNQFNRVGAIADDSSLDFTAAPNGEKILNGYIVDDVTELPDNSDDTQWGTNLIG